MHWWVRFPCSTCQDLPGRARLKNERECGARSGTPPPWLSVTSRCIWHAETIGGAPSRMPARLVRLESLYKVTQYPVNHCGGLDADQLDLAAGPLVLQRSPPTGSSLMQCMKISGKVQKNNGCLVPGSGQTICSVLSNIFALHKIPSVAMFDIASPSPLRPQRYSCLTTPAWPGAPSAFGGP